MKTFFATLAIMFSTMIGAPVMANDYNSTDKGWIENSWNSVKDTTSNAWVSIKETSVDTANFIAEKADTSWRVMSDATQNTWKSVKDTSSNLIAKIGNSEIDKKFQMQFSMMDFYMNENEQQFNEMKNKLHEMNKSLMEMEKQAALALIEDSITRLHAIQDQKPNEKTLDEVRRRLALLYEKRGQMTGESDAIW